VAITGVVAEGQGAVPPPPLLQILACHKNFLFCQKVFFQKCQLWGWKFSISGDFKRRITILSTRNLRSWKFAAVCRKIATSCPWLYLFNPQRRWWQYLLLILHYHQSTCLLNTIAVVFISSITRLSSYFNALNFQTLASNRDILFSQTVIPISTPLKHVLALTLETKHQDHLLISTTYIQREPKNTPTRRSRYLRNARIFLYQILLICVVHNCAKVCCFVLYLLDIRQINGNANFKNKFCNCTDSTKGWFNY